MMIKMTAQAQSHHATNQPGMRSTRNRILATLAFTLLALTLPTASVDACTGHLRISSSEASILHLQHQDGWAIRVGLGAGETIIWDLPTGAYALSWNEFADPVETVFIWEHLTTPIEISPEERRFRVGDEPDDGRGLVLLLKPGAWAALPGSKEEILTGLDTHARWRPGARIDGLPTVLACERRELLPGQSHGLGPSWISHAPGGAVQAPSTWNLTLGQPLPHTPGCMQPVEAKRNWASMAVAARRNSRDGSDLSAHLALTRLPWLKIPARGLATVRYADLSDADPRATAERILPHNDIVQLDLTARLEIGPAETRILTSSPAGTPSTQLSAASARILPSASHDARAVEA
ncbi:MAG: hypothetical protein KAY24_10770, partial [Candidatus Eisenbacteria sp.]|nr:hypothetical protein [Candidatus Eisenbacteria bacterium]